MKSEMVLSPFSEETYEEQQRRWLIWRAEMLAYQPENGDCETKKMEKLPPVTIPEPVRMPESLIRSAAYTYNSHTQLDSLYAKHKAAGKSAVNWQTIHATVQNP